MAKNKGNQNDMQEDVNLGEATEAVEDGFMAEQSDAQVATEAQMAANAESDAAAAKAVGAEGEDDGEPKDYVSDTTGRAISRSAYIRQEFMKDRSRGDIAKEIGVAYGIVYSATANMENAHHANNEDGTTNRGVVVEVTGEDGETRKISRAERARELVAGGMTRGQAAKELGVAYATVYAATKDQTVEGGANRSGGRVVVSVETTEGVKSVPRATYIREQFASGKTRREIADELHCDYAVVWAATKGSSEGQELREGTNEAPAAEPVVIDDQTDVSVDNIVDEQTDVPAGDTVIEN